MRLFTEAISRQLFYVSTIGFLSFAMLILFAPPSFINFPSNREVQIEKTPGETFVRQEVTPGTFKIKVPWEETEFLRDNAISSVQFDETMAAFRIESWRSDLSTEGVFEYSSKSVDTPTTVYLRWVPVSIQNKNLFMDKQLRVKPIIGVIGLIIFLGGFSAGLFFDIQD